MSTSQQQSLHFNSKGPGDSIQTRLALLSHLTEKQEGSSIYKKKTFFWDQEHLYSENLMLKAQVKQLTQTNTKSRTTILEMEAEMKQKQTRNNEHDLKQSALRSMSLRNLGKKSMIVLRPSHQDEGKSRSIRQIIRQLKQEIAALKNEKEIIKRSLKYTRMSELQALNKEMDIELQRLNRLVNENKSKYYALALEMEALHEVLKKERLAKQLIGQERDKIRRELAKTKNDNNEYQKRIQFSQKQSRHQIKKLRSINPEIVVLNTESAAKSLGKLNSQSFKSIPKLQYSISGLQRIQNDTINFNRLLNSESQLKSIPKITSFTSLELQKMSFKNDGNSPEQKVRTSEKVESCSEMENLEEEAYEFEEDEVEVEEVKKAKELKTEEIYEQDETEIIKQAEEPKVKEEFKEHERKVVKQKSEPKTDQFFEDQVVKVNHQAEKPKKKTKQEEWEEELQEFQEYDDNDKEIVKQKNVQKTEELFQEFNEESFEPIQQPKKNGTVKEDNPILKNTKRLHEESFEEDDAQIIKEFEEPLPKEKVESKAEPKHEPLPKEKVESKAEPKHEEPLPKEKVESKAEPKHEEPLPKEKVESKAEPKHEEPLPEEKVQPKADYKQHLPIASTKTPLPSEEVKEQKTQSKQPLPAPFKQESPNHLLAIEAKKEETVSIRPSPLLAIEENKEEFVEEQVKEESIFEDLMVEEEI